MVKDLRETLYPWLMDDLRDLNERADKAAGEGRVMGESWYRWTARGPEVRRAEASVSGMLHRMHLGSLALIADSEYLSEQYAGSIAPL